MIITKEKLQQLIDEEFSRAIAKRRQAKLNEAIGDDPSLGPGRPHEPEPVDGASEDDADNATNALYGLDMLHVFFNTPELERARTTVMRRLQEIADSVDS